MIARGLSCRLSGPMSSLERARPLLHEGRFARPVRGKREWDENENEAESWQVERTALRQPPQAFEKRSRRAERKTPFSPRGMASIAIFSRERRGAELAGAAVGSRKAFLGDLPEPRRRLWLDRPPPPKRKGQNPITLTGFGGLCGKTRFFASITI
jgi:hypothetical protein